MDNAFGNNLKALRLAKEMTQQELADFMNVSVVTVCHWEKAKQEPSIKDIKRLSRLFQVTTDFLLGA